MHVFTCICEHDKCSTSTSTNFVSGIWRVVSCYLFIASWAKHPSWRISLNIHQASMFWLAKHRLYLKKKTTHRLQCIVCVCGFFKFVICRVLAIYIRPLVISEKNSHSIFIKHIQKDHLEGDIVYLRAVKPQHACI